MLKITIEYYDIMNNVIKTKEYFLGRFKKGVNAWHLFPSEKDLGDEVPVTPLDTWCRNDEEIKSLLDAEIFMILNMSAGEFVTRLFIEDRIINYDLLVRIIDKVRKVDNFCTCHYSYMVSIEHSWLRGRAYAHYTPEFKEFKLFEV